MSIRPLLIAVTLILCHDAAQATDNSYCSQPGEEVVKGSPILGTPVDDPVPGQNIRAIYWAEPAGKTEELAITMTVNTLPQPALGFPIYQIFFSLGAHQVYYLAYEPSAAPEAQFYFGRSDASQRTGARLGATDPASKAQADGTITWVLSRNRIDALKAATFVSDIYGVVKEETPPLNASTERVFGDVTVTNSGTYQLRGNESCGSAIGKAAVVTGAFGGGALPLWLLAPFAMGAWLRRTKRGRAWGKKSGSN